MDAEKRTVTTTRHEYILRSPPPIGELNKAVNWAFSDKTAAMTEDRHADDAPTVEARDDEIVIYWEEATRA